MRISPRTAVLFKALRKQLSELLSRRIAQEDGEGARGARGAREAWASLPAAASFPGAPGWPPPMETREQAHSALLAAVVWLIGRGVELQSEELTGRARDQPGGKVAPPTYAPSGAKR